ncbi:MAG: DUF3846 domain-containing protein [Lachnospiraceae bacterium]|nr:DUF3846 domain-containing protein [Lachnospiraceae bacterium]MCM1237108.1 DUF3846 domain-containing protein [Ruminococcus flavefaciens]
MKKKVKNIKAYFLRIDEEHGVPYKGYVGSIANELEAKQKYVNFGRQGGTIQVVHLNSKLDVICHDEGKLLSFPLNRAWIVDSGITLDVFAGNIMVVRHKGAEFASILDDDIFYIEKYLLPVMKVGEGRYIVLPKRSLPRWKGAADEYSD